MRPFPACPQIVPQKSLTLVVPSILWFFAWLCFPSAVGNAQTAWQAGFAKADITPQEPVRLSGYATRNESHVGVADPLFARAMALAPADNSQRHRAVILVSVDSIAVSSAMSVEISQWTNETYQIPRSQIVLSSSHSHTAPHIAGALTNLYRQESTPEQQAATEKYTRQVVEAIREVISQAMEALRPASLSMGLAESTVAVNRRVLIDGKWSTFGEQVDGPVDHRVRVMQATSESGELLGAAFMYACHCTTLSPDFNQISGDWAGIAASRLENLHAGAVFLPVIGCGADANPNPRGVPYEIAERHAADIIDAVQAGLAETNSEPLLSFPQAHFGYAGLAPEQPSSELLAERLQSEQPNERRWAEHMLQVKKDMGRLPETYPMPIHTWQFGDQLTWVFLGGEVVVDYQYLIEKELPTQQTWVAAYTDDVFAYVASERMRSEGGYEVDFSMIYYMQPGRWQSGTQSLIVRRVAEIFRQEVDEARPRSPDEGLQSMRVPEGYQVDLVAAEPLVQDPINLAFGPDGSVWVVEMADYPRGTSGGRVKRLRDTDGDGRLDDAQTFLSDLSFPTSVQPWQDGALVIEAPHVFFARDSDGDGIADEREILLSGLAEANPQHRASGFEIGLDGWLHFGGGSGTQQLVSDRNGETYDVRGNDIVWHPQSGKIRATSGDTQFVRSRDAWGNWFGNSNSHPIYQFVIDERYLDGKSLTGGIEQHLLTPAVAPPVFPRSRTVDRFNDLFAHNRFTSACSSIIVRVPGLAGPDETVGLICEPVHNLVARIQVQVEDSHFTATRHSQDVQYDFFTSTDPWSRPVRVVNAPDGSVWIVDMVRQVIEHPEWIPTAWQERLDLTSGAQHGRIYRVHRSDYTPLPPADLSAPTADLLAALRDVNGAVRDLALLQLLSGDYSEIEKDIRRLASTHTQPAVRVAAWGALAAKDWLTTTDLSTALSDPDARVVAYTLQLCERVATSQSEFRQAFVAVAHRRLGPQVDLQWVLSSTRLKELDLRGELTAIASRSAENTWTIQALSLIENPQTALAVAQGLLSGVEQGESIEPRHFAALEACITRLWDKAPSADRTAWAERQLSNMLSNSAQVLRPDQLLLLAVLTNARADQPSKLNDLLSQVATAGREMLVSADTDEPQRLVLVNLLGCGLAPVEEELQLARRLLRTQFSAPVTLAVIERLRQVDDQGAAEVLLQAWPELDAQARATAAATLLAKRDWTRRLVEALESETLHPNQLDLATLQRLRSYPDRDLRARCLEVLGKPSPRSGVVANYLAKMPPPSASKNGEILFREQCSACHQTTEGKSQLGPPLENLGHWTLDQWVTAILDPNQVVEPKYRQQLCLTHDGQIISGIVVSESADTVQMALSDGSIRDIPRAEIESLKDASTSLMPEGFEQKLSPEELSALLGYLRHR